MIRHILIVAWRNICKYKVSAGIAVVGLAMGLLCFVLCNFCARLFFSIDKVFPNYDRMAEIQIKVGEGGELQDYLPGHRRLWPGIWKRLFRDRSSVVRQYPMGDK